MCFNRSPNCAIKPNYEVVEFQTQSGITTVLYSAAYCYVILPLIPCYSSPHISFHTRSSSHPGVVCLHLSISIYRTKLNKNTGVSHLRLSIPTTRSDSLPSPGPYCMTLPSCHLRILAFREISSRVAQSYLSAILWLHHAFLLRSLHL